MAGGVVAGRGGPLGYALVDGDDPHVGQHCLPDDTPCRRHILIVQFLREDQIHPIARPDQAAVAGDGIDANRNGAGARRQHGGEKPAVTRVQYVARHQGGARIEIAAQQGATQAREDLRTVHESALRRVCRGNRPVGEVVLLHQRPRGKIVRSDDDLDGHRLRRGLVSGRDPYGDRRPGYLIANKAKAHGA